MIFYDFRLGLPQQQACSRWIPENLTATQKMFRVNWCKEKLTKFRRGISPNVYSIATGDETYIHLYEPETKQSTV